MITTLLNILFIINCLVLVVAILFQAGSGGGLGAGLSGGTASTAVFGGRGPGGLLARVTMVCAAIFMLASLLLAHLSSRSQSVVDLSDDSEEVVSDVDSNVIEEGSLPTDGIKALNKQNGADDAPALMKKPIEVNKPLPIKTPAVTTPAPTPDVAPAELRKPGGPSEIKVVPVPTITAPEGAKPAPALKVVPTPAPATSTP